MRFSSNCCRREFCSGSDAKTRKDNRVSNITNNDCTDDVMYRKIGKLLLFRYLVDAEKKVSLDFLVVWNEQKSDDKRSVLSTLINLIRSN